jgi:hypothetical protein
MLGAGLWGIIIPRLLAVAEFLALTAVGVGALYVAYRLLARLAARTKTAVDDRIIAATKRPALIFVSLASLRAVAPSRRRSGCPTRFTLPSTTPCCC